VLVIKNCFGRHTKCTGTTDHPTSTHLHRLLPALLITICHTLTAEAVFINNE